MQTFLIGRRIREVFGPDADAAVKIATCESGLNPDRVGDHGLVSSAVWRLVGDYGDSIGIFQIRLLPGRPSREWLMVPENNIQYAHNLFKAQSWSPWSCRKVL